MTTPHTPSEADVTVLGGVHYRRHNTPFGIRRSDRRHHLYILGKTGVGKSTLLVTLTRFSGEDS